MARVNDPAAQACLDETTGDEKGEERRAFIPTDSRKPIDTCTAR